MGCSARAGGPETNTKLFDSEMVFSHGSSNGSRIYLFVLF